MYETITTARLRLVPMDQVAPETIAAAINDVEVSRWLSHVPYPYDLQDAKGFLADLPYRAGQGWAIFDDTGFVGSISVPGTLGYWLRRDAWGKGYMTEAGDAALDAYFEGTTHDEISVHHAIENQASGHVIVKLGFEFTHEFDADYPARGQQVPSYGYKLTRAQWQKRRCFQIETDRLILRNLTQDDWRDIQRIAGNDDVAPMLASVASPWSESAVKTWISRGQYRGRANFRAAICLKDGQLIGSLGIGKPPGPGAQSCYYFIDKSFWGQGFISEALHALFHRFLAEFEIDVVEADHFDDNPASGAVLRKLGFEQYGHALAKSAARVEPAPVTLYRLRQQDLKARL